MMMSEDNSSSDESEVEPVMGLAVEGAEEDP